MKEKKTHLLPSVCVACLHVNAVVSPGLEMAHHGPSSLILEILSQHNEWCKIGTYVSLFCKPFIIPRLPVFQSNPSLLYLTTLHRLQESNIT